MVAAQTVQVLETKLADLEKDHDFLGQIREKSSEVDALEEAYNQQNEETKLAKKALEKAEVELRALIQAGPPKPDPQKRLPFADDFDETNGAMPAEATQGVAAAEPAAEAAEPAKVEIPPELQDLDISVIQKERLVKAGCNTLADVVDLGNKNWPQYPQGFQSLEGFGPKAVSKLKALLPSTAPKKTEGTEEVTYSRIRLLMWVNANGNLEPGSEYDAQVLENGNAIVQLPNQEPTILTPPEFEKVLVTSA